MRIAVNPGRCQGHALCLAAAPDLFDFDDEAGRARPYDDVLPREHLGAARNAASACPEQAVILSDQPASRPAERLGDHV